MLVDLGAGNDHFTGNIAGNVNTANGLDLEVYGRAGNDSITVNQTGQTLAGAFVPYMEGDAGNDTLVYNGTGTIAANASVTPEFSGGAGNDNIKATYSGVIQGNYIYNLSADGGPGNDNVIENVTALAGSTGSVGTSSATPAAVEGGAKTQRQRPLLRRRRGPLPTRRSRSTGSRWGTPARTPSRGPRTSRATSPTRRIPSSPDRSIKGSLIRPPPSRREGGISCGGEPIGRQPAVASTGSSMASRILRQVASKAARSSSLRAFGPSERALSGSGWTSRNRTSHPTATAALAR